MTRLNYEHNGSKKLDSKMSLLSYRVSDFILFNIFFLLAFQNAFQKLFGGAFAYIDEFSALLLCCWAVFSMQGHKTRYCMISRYLLLINSLLLLLGLCGNLLYKLQPAYQAIAIDAFACSKFIISLISSVVILQKRSVIELASSFAKFILPLLLILYFLNQFIDLGLSSGERLGYSFLFGHPTNFAATVVCLISILLLDVKSNRLFIVCGLLVLCATGRFKAIGFAFIIAAAVFLYSNKKKIPLSFILLAGCGALFLVYDQISLYFFDSTTARSVLLSTSFDVANMHWPLGSGLATYGSNASADYYSSFYYSLGFPSVYGLGPMNHDYLVDSFWPAVIGQCGYIGLLLVAIIFVLLFSMSRKAVDHGVPLWASFAIPIYLLIASTSEASIFSSYSVLLAMTFALLTADSNPFHVGESDE